MSYRKVLDDIDSERERQDDKWGGDDHDDNLSQEFFIQLIKDYAGWARVMLGMDNVQKYRRRMIQVAALATAAVESLDRRVAVAQNLLTEEV